MSLENPPSNEEKILCMYSGGSDSTLAAAIAANRSNKVYLLTLKRYGLFNPTRASHNITYLRHHFPNVTFEHIVDSFESEYKTICYDKNFLVQSTFDLRNASVCGVCKLGMHWKTIKICQSLGIKNVFDGSVRTSRIFPEQNRIIMLEELEKLYWKCGIKYENPVFELNSQEELYKLGIIFTKKLKGSDGDYQPICSQQVLFAKYAEIALALGTVEQYENDLSSYYTIKIQKLWKELSKTFSGNS